MTVQELRDENEALLKQSDSHLKDCNDMLSLNNKEMALHYLKIAEHCNEQRLINCKRMEALEKSKKQNRLIGILEGALNPNTTMYAREKENLFISDTIKVTTQEQIKEWKKKSFDALRDSISKMQTAKVIDEPIKKENTDASDALSFSLERLRLSNCIKIFKEYINKVSHNERLKMIFDIYMQSYKEIDQNIKNKVVKKYKSEMYHMTVGYLNNNWSPLKFESLLIKMKEDYESLVVESKFKKGDDFRPFTEGYEGRGLLNLFGKEDAIKDKSKKVIFSYHDKEYPATVKSSSVKSISESDIIDISSCHEIDQTKIVIRFMVDDFYTEKDYTKFAEKVQKQFKLSPLGWDNLLNKFENKHGV